MAQTQGGATVTVASKLPCGLALHIHTFEERPEHVNGSKMAKVAVRLADAYVLNGSATPEGMSPQGYSIYGGYAITSGIPKEFMDQWMLENKDADYVKNGLVFVHSSESNARAEALEKKDKATGLERLNPTALPREFKGKIEAVPKTN